MQIPNKVFLFFFLFFVVSFYGRFFFSDYGSEFFSLKKLSDGICFKILNITQSQHCQELEEEKK